MKLLLVALVAACAADPAAMPTGDGDVTLLLGNGDGTFRQDLVMPAGAGALASVIADFNGDGRMDIAVASDGALVFVNRGDGTFSSDWYPADGWPEAIAAADVDLDGTLDLLIPGTKTIRVFRGYGDGRFRDALTYPGATARGIAIADFNEDGAPDLAMTNPAHTFAVLLGDGHAGFGAPSWLPATKTPHAVVSADVNRDGHADLVTAGSDIGIFTNDWPGIASVYLGAGDGSFGSPTDYDVGQGAAAVAVTDGDLVVGDFGDGAIDVLDRKPDGTFEAPRSLGGASNVNNVAVADFNMDGAPDVAAASYGRVVVLLRNAGGVPDLPADHGVLSVSSGDIDGDGIPDLVVTRSTGGGSLPL